MKKSLIVLLVLTLALGIVGCGKKDEVVESETDVKIVKLGINSDELSVWNHIKDELAKENIQLEIVTFGDYTRPNLALAEGEIDINAFQHYAFFDKFVEDHKLDLTPIGETVIAPLGLYSNKYDSIDEIKENFKIAIPNDATNGGRALNLLKSAGLIDVSDTPLPVLDDIVENKLNLEFIEVDASLIPRTLDDVDYGIINSGFAVNAGYTPSEDSVYLEEINESTNPYINIIVAKTKDKDKEELNRVVELYQTDEVKGLIDEIYKGSQRAAW